MKLSIKYILLSIVLTALSSPSLADDQVEGRATVYGDAHTTRAELEAQALQAARINALERKYGKVASENFYQRDVETVDKSDTYVSITSETEVMGEWVADSGAPVYERSSDSEGNHVITCIVKGIARPRTNSAVDFDWAVLRNGTNLHNRSTNFYAGDRLYLIVKTPCDGYLAVFLRGEDNSYSSLLPGPGDSFGSFKVKKGKEYVLFTDDCEQLGLSPTDNYVMTLDSEGNRERNEIVIVFSPNEFAVPVANKVMYDVIDRPDIVTQDRFQKWLNKSRLRDASMSIKKAPINISRFEL